jgi:hypothetical protein
MMPHDLCWLVIPGAILCDWRTGSNLHPQKSHLRGDPTAGLYRRKSSAGLPMDGMTPFGNPLTTMKSLLMPADSIGMNSTITDLLGKPGIFKHIK